MGILSIGIVLFIVILVWAGRTKTSYEWADYQEQRHFEQEQDLRRWLTRYFF